MLEVLKTMIIAILVLLGPLGLIGIVIATIKRKPSIFIFSFTSLAIFLIVFIPSFISPTDRAKEGMLKSDMHFIQLYVEEYQIKNKGLSPSDTTLLRILPKNFQSKGTYHGYSRFLMTDFDNKIILEQETKTIGYMIGYALDSTKTKYILIGTNKNGQPFSYLSNI